MAVPGPRASSMNRRRYTPWPEIQTTTPPERA